MRQTTNCTTTPDVMSARFCAAISTILGSGCQSKAGKDIVTEPRAVATGPSLKVSVDSKRPVATYRPKRAARLGTPVRSRFCNDGSLLSPTLDRNTALKVFLVRVMDPLCVSPVELL